MKMSCCSHGKVFLYSVFFLDKDWEKHNHPIVSTIPSICYILLLQGQVGKLNGDMIGLSVLEPLNLW